MRVGVQRKPWPLYPHERYSVFIAQETEWASEPVWTGAEKLAPTVNRSPDRPALSESLYRLSYPCSHPMRTHITNCKVTCLFYSGGHSACRTVLHCCAAVVFLVCVLRLHQNNTWMAERFIHDWIYSRYADNVTTVGLCSEQNIKPDILSRTAQHEPPFRWCLVCSFKELLDIISNFFSPSRSLSLPYHFPVHSTWCT